MIADAAVPASLIVVVGLTVGWASAITGLGAGLALPLLAAAGLPLPSALLAVKLPVTVSDVARALGQARDARWSDAGRGAHARTASMLCCAWLAGAASMGIVLRIAPATSLAAAPLLALAALMVSARTPHRGATQALCWGAYVGGCGVGATLLWRAAGWRHRVSQQPAAGSRPGAACAALPWFAAANLGALVMLLAAGQQPTPAVCLLACAQGAGAWCASALTRSTRWQGLVATLRRH